MVPIARPLRDILLTLPGRAAEGFVFTYAGKPMRDITDGMKAACKAAGIVYGRFKDKGFVFHDLTTRFHHLCPQGRGGAQRDYGDRRAQWRARVT